MRDHQYNAVRDYCKPIFELWIKRLNLVESVQLNWRDDFFSQDRDGHGYQTLAFCDANWAYMSASITISCAKLWEHFDPETLRPVDPEWIEEIIIHEILHIIVNEMRDYDASRHRETVGHEERVVVRLARAFLFLRMGEDPGGDLIVKGEG